jgi:AIPR protein
MTSEIIKYKVREFQIRTNFGSTDEDNFAPWWIQQNFKLSDEESTMVSSDGSINLGLDGFYIQEKEDKMILTLVQAKFSEEINQIVKAIAEIGKFIPKLSQILDSFDSPVEERDILAKRLKQRIKSTTVFTNKPLEISAIILSLHAGTPDEISPKIEKNKTELFNLFEKKITNPNIVFSLSVLTLDNLVENGKIDSRRPAKPFEIHFDGSDEIDMNNSVFLSGFGRLPDLVSLYEQKGNQLFEKNVRLYLFGKRNEVKGPAGKIKETLEAINSGKFPPEKFAFLHNGVTIYSTKVKAKKKEKNAELVNPSVLNGCQTIKSAYFFYQEAISKNKLNRDIWAKIPVSIRLVATDDKELWREVAEANNRQNSMSAAALRANDEIQITLENRFKDAGIYYERQEGAFENLLREGKEKFQQKYSNSAKEPVYIDTLAQALICCTELPLAYATRISEIFEVKKLYDKVFSNKNLQNIQFLILAHNVRRVIEYAVRNAVPGNATKIYADFKGSKYRDLFTRLLLKIIIKNNLLEIYIATYGTAVLSAQGKSATLLIDDLRELIKAPGISILQKVTETYRLFDDIGEKHYWEKQTNQDLYESIVSKLKLGNIDILAS